jgi:hypothetical protein
MPKAGELYIFREDNRKFVSERYGYYFVGLALCIQSDVICETNFPTSVTDALRHNPIYGFETYNCVQHFDTTIIISRGIKAPEIIFLTFREVSDMMALARSA